VEALREPLPPRYGPRRGGPGLPEEPREQHEVHRLEGERDPEQRAVAEEVRDQPAGDREERAGEDPEERRRRERGRAGPRVRGLRDRGLEGGGGDHPEARTQVRGDEERGDGPRLSLEHRGRDEEGEPRHREETPSDREGPPPSEVREVPADGLREGRDEPEPAADRLEESQEGEPAPER